MSLIKSDIILEQMMSLHPKVIDLTLSRVRRLLKAVGSPEKSLPPVIHIAGTNGKGSTLAMIRAGLEAGGKSTHAYTSPHLKRFNERIRLSGKLIEEDDLSAILNECYKANGSGKITYFEITTSAALLAMARSEADYALLEVGLGGRLDATNVIAQPVLCIITPISIDHKKFLGNTISKIAFEKAGIIKKDVPVIVGPQIDSAMKVIEEVAAKHNATLITHGQKWHVFEADGRLIYEDEKGLLDLPLPVLLGEHQISNAGMALATLRHLNMVETSMEGALAKAEWPARMQRLKQGALVDLAASAELWLDGGHNVAAGKVVAAFIATLPKKPTYLICGMLDTKDFFGYLRPFANHVEGLISIAIPGEHNTLRPETLAASGKLAGINSTAGLSIHDAIYTITTKAPHARILICGSLHLAGIVLKYNDYSH